MIMTAPRPTRPRIAPSPDTMLSVAEAAHETGFTPRHIRRLCDGGNIRAIQHRPGSAYRIRRAWLIAAFPSLYDLDR